MARRLEDNRCIDRESSSYISPDSTICIRRLYIDIEALLDRQNRKLARKVEEEDHITKEPLAEQLAKRNSQLIIIQQLL